MARLSKRMRDAREGIEDKTLDLQDALAEVCKRSKVKFDEAVDIALNLGVDPRHADQMVRGVCNLPHGTGKTVRVAVFARGDKAEEAKSAGADLVGDEDLIASIQGGEINFDRCIATPDMMPMVSKLGQILGPRKLMPNPRVGTVTNKIAETVEQIKKGTVEFRVEKAGIVHLGTGRVSFGVDKLSENVLAAVNAVRKAKPSGAKGTYLLGMTISSTMGPSFKVSIADMS